MTARRGGTVWERALLAGGLAYFFVLRLLQGYSKSGNGLYWASSDRGEALLHRIAWEGISFGMPLPGVLAALTGRHFPGAEAAVFVAEWASVVTLAYALGREFGSEITGLLACLGTMLLVRPGLDEGSLYNFSVLLVAMLTVLWARRPSQARSAWLGAAIGLSLLIRSPLFLFPVLLVVFGWLRLERMSVGSRLRALTPLAAVPALMLLPWADMNWRLFGRWIPLEKDRADCNIVAGVLGLRSTIEGDARSLVGLGPDDNVMAWAVGRILWHPLDYLGSCLARLWFAVSLHPALVLLTLVCIPICRRRRGWPELGLLALYLTGIHCLMAVEPRYFEPVWPLLAIMIAAAAAQLPAERSKGAEGFSRACAALCGIPALSFGLFVLVLAARYPSLPSASEAALSKELARYPRDAWLLSLRGRRRMERREPQLAMEDFSAAFAQQPGRETAMDCAWALLAQGRPAGGLIAQVPTWKGSFPRTRLHLLELLSSLQRKDSEGAIAAYRRADRAREDEVLVRDGYTPKGKEIRGILELGKRDSVASAASSLMADWPLPSRRAILSETRRMPSLKEPFEKAWFDELRGLDPDSEGAISHARDLRSAGRLDEALAVLNDVVAKNPYSVRALTDRGVVNAMLRKRQSAIRDLRTAYRLDPDFLPASVTLGAVYLELGRKDLVRELYRGVISRPPPMSERFLWLLIAGDARRL